MIDVMCALSLPPSGGLSPACVVMVISRGRSRDHESCETTVGKGDVHHAAPKIGDHRRDVSP
jgi:hypothetical protein